jgi:hypothetical protein
MHRDVMVVVVVEDPSHSLNHQRTEESKEQDSAESK